MVTHILHSYVLLNVKISNIISNFISIYFGLQKAKQVLRIFSPKNTNGYTHFTKLCMIEFQHN